MVPDPRRLCVCIAVKCFPHRLSTGNTCRRARTIYHSGLTPDAGWGSRNVRGRPPRGKCCRLWSSKYGVQKNTAVHILPLQNQLNLSLCFINLNNEILDKVRREMLKTPTGHKMDSCLVCLGASGTSEILQECKKAFLRSNTHSPLKVGEHMEEDVESAIFLRCRPPRNTCGLPHYLLGSRCSSYVYEAPCIFQKLFQKT